MMRWARPFGRAWLVVGIAALVVYCALPAVVLVASGGETWWYQLAWIAPGALACAGLYLGTRRPGPAGPILVLAGGLLLSLTTAFYFMMLLAVHMVGSQVALVILGIVGLVGPGRLRWGFVTWTAVLAVPVLVGAVAGYWAMTYVGSGAEGVEFPMAQGVRFEFQGPGPVEGLEGVEEPQGPQFVGVETLPWETRGRFEYPVAEAMRTYRSALEAEGWSVTPGEVGDVLSARKADVEARLEFREAAGAGATGGESAAGGGTVLITLTRL